METVPLDEIRRLNEAAGQFWFSAGALRFFRSRFAAVAYKTRDGARAYFVSSEQFVDSAGVRHKRRFTVRVAALVPMDDHRAGRIDTVGDFQQYATRSGADAAARRFAAALPLAGVGR